MPCRISAERSGATGVSPVHAVLHWRHASGTHQQVFSIVCVIPAIQHVAIMPRQRDLWLKDVSTHHFNNGRGIGNQVRRAALGRVQHLVGIDAQFTVNG